MPYAAEYDAHFANLVQRLRAHAIEVADALDAALAVRSILATADLPDRVPLTWDDVLARQPTEMDRADLAAKADRALNTAALPMNPRPQEDPQ